MLETYDETPNFIPVNVIEDEFKYVAQKLSVDSGLVGTDLEALQGWLLKFGDDIKILRSSMENFVNWLSNKSPPWAAYRSFMYGRLIALDKNPGVCLVGVRETWGHIFAKIVWS